MNLYITVGVPGGEFAGWFAGQVEAQGVLAEHAVGYGGRRITADLVPVRLAPPDVVDWVMDDKLYNLRDQVPGGWRYRQFSEDDRVISESFIPVPPTANLTIINPEDAPE